MKPLDQKFIVIIPVIILMTIAEVTYFLYRMWSDVLLTTPLNEDNVRLCELMTTLLFLLFAELPTTIFPGEKKSSQPKDNSPLKKTFDKTSTSTMLKWTSFFCQNYATTRFRILSWM
jgi:hypothetical protein